MFKIYLRDKSQQVHEKHMTEDRNEAAQFFEEMISRTELDGQLLAAVITYNSQQIAYHRFDRLSDQSHNWRGRVDEIEWPETEPARKPGRPRVYGGIRKNIMISQELWDRAIQIGNGNASAGIQKAVAEFALKK